ncbi:MAG: hypothetical protein K0R34_1788 [Herbinix sp.]|nr:hypothetical protein [Herbinix sp.]
MNEKAAIMNKEIQAVASYRALLISKWFLSSFLLTVALYLGMLRFPISPLYILLFLNALPPIFTFAAKDYGKKSQNRILHDIITDVPFLLGTIKIKYKYSKLHYLSNSAAYLISLFLIGLWQYNYSQQYYLPIFLKTIPVSLLAISIVIRLIGIIYYRWKLPYDIAHNRL